MIMDLTLSLFSPIIHNIQVLFQTVQNFFFFFPPWKKSPCSMIHSLILYTKIQSLSLCPNIEFSQSSVLDPCLSVYSHSWLKVPFVGRPQYKWWIFIFFCTFHFCSSDSVIHRTFQRNSFLWNAQTSLHDNWFQKDYITFWNPKLLRSYILLVRVDEELFKRFWV